MSLLQMSDNTPLKNTYKQIWQVAYPIIISGIAENIINVTDTAFLGRVGEIELGAAGLGSILYLLFFMLCFGFGIGTQIIIARRIGEGKVNSIGSIMEHSIYMLCLFAVVLFFLMKAGVINLFDICFSSNPVYQATNIYLGYRSYGIFFAAIAIAFRSFFVGIAKTKIIIWSALIVSIVNIFLDYCLIFGKLGFPEMGIAGAAIASVAAEACGMLFLIIYTLLFVNFKRFHLFRFAPLSINIFKRITKVASPLVYQFMIALTAWFLFFVIIEQIGERELAASNIIRSISAFLAIPTWGLATAVNTLVSNLIGQGNKEQVLAMIVKAIKLSLGIMCCVIIASALLAKPMLMIYTNNQVLIDVSQTLLYILLPVLLFFSISTILFNGLVGTGDTRFSMLIETISVLTYLLFAFLVGIIFNLGIQMVWASEIIYWVLIGIFAYSRIKSKKWMYAKV